jgi:hypothetical protein
MNSGAATRRTSVIQPGCHRKDSECQQMWAVEQAIEMHSKALWHRNACGTLRHQFELCKMKRWHSGYLLATGDAPPNKFDVCSICSAFFEKFVEFQRPGIKSCRSLALHWGGRALARRIRLPREMQTDSWVSSWDWWKIRVWSQDLQNGYLQTTHHGLSWFPKEKDQQPICSLEWLCDWLWLTFWPVGPIPICCDSVPESRPDPCPGMAMNSRKGLVFSRVTGCLNHEQTHVNTMKCDRAHAT